MKWFVLPISMMVMSHLACKQEHPAGVTASTSVDTVAQEGKLHIDYDPSLWSELTADDGFVLDIRYATPNNFVKEVIYPCGRFFLRPEVAEALRQVNKSLGEHGYKLLLFDGYRPTPAQQKLWDKVPDRNYVAPPAEGSMHNRGVAVDLSLADMDGKEVDMGTAYDYFGPEAHRDYTQLPDPILQRRQLLRSTMETHGFQSIRTEWWHFSFSRGTYPLDLWQWPCK